MVWGLGLRVLGQFVAELDRIGGFVYGRDNHKGFRCFLKQNSCRWTSSNCRHGFDAGFMKSVNQKFPVI